MKKTGLARLPKGWETTIGTAYLKGAADVEVRAELRITRKFWDILMTDPDTAEFREIVEFGRMLSQAWWLGQARTNLQNKQFNAPLWYMVMKNQFGWSDKTTTTTKDSNDMTSDELEERITAALAKFKKVTRTQ